jgi:hypothetical protein
MDDQNEIDMSLMAYDKWLLFVFDRPAPDRRELGKEWYWDYGYEISHPSCPSRLVEHVTRLCDQFVEVANTYSLAQVDQAIWFLLGAPIEFGDYLREPQISRDLRKCCVESMYRVFADFVAVSDVLVMENCFYMWWDMLLGDFYRPNEDELDEDAKDIENTILDTLTRILGLDDLRTQQYALHGLGHMKHPKARDVVAGYINARGEEWTEEGRQWLYQCRDGTVM